jgi:hypothetical protein
MTSRIQLRRGTSSEWSTVNPTLSSGEVGYEVDSGKFKIGNGSTLWSTLDYFGGEVDLSGYLTLSSASNTYQTKIIDIVTKSGAYTLASGDENELIQLSGSSSYTISIPTDETFNFAIGTQINLLSTGTGVITIAAVTPGTTTVNATPGLKLRAQWSSATLIKRAANTWVAIGDLAE